MTIYKSLKELQKHNEEVRKRRALEKQDKEEVSVEEKVEEKQEPVKKTSKGRKPKNREYMVVEEIPTETTEEKSEEVEVQE